MKTKQKSLKGRLEQLYRTSKSKLGGLFNKQPASPGIDPRISELGDMSVEKINIPTGLAWLGETPTLPTFANEDLNKVVQSLSEQERLMLASEMANGLTEDTLLKSLDEHSNFMYDNAFEGDLINELANGLSREYDLDGGFSPLISNTLPIDMLQRYTDRGFGLGEANEAFKKISDGKVDLLDQIIGDKPLDQSLPIGSPLLGSPDTSPVYGWNVDKNASPNLPTSTTPITSSAGGGTTVPPKNGKGLKGFFENAKGNASNAWNNKVKPAVSGVWNGKIKPEASSVLQYMKAHPGMSAGLGITGTANLAGLFDNDKVGGQLLGAGLGAGLGYGILPKLAGTISPQAQLLTTLTGGSLGALFDNLRSKQEKEREQQRYIYR